MCRPYPNAENGQGLVEYALILMGVALVIVLALSLTGTKISDVYCEVVDSLGGQGCDPSSCGYSFDDDTALDNWSGAEVGPSLLIEEGKLCSTNHQHSYFEGCGSDKTPSDFTVNLEGVTVLPTGSQHSGFDFTFRNDDQGNGYWFSYSSKSNVVTFWKVFKTKRIRLSGTRVPVEWGQQELNFKIEVKGNTFTAYKDGEVILQASDDSYTEGTFSWRNKPGSKTCLDEISFE